MMQALADDSGATARLLQSAVAAYRAGKFGEGRGLLPRKPY